MEAYSSFVQFCTWKRLSSGTLDISSSIFHTGCPTKIAEVQISREILWFKPSLSMKILSINNFTIKLLSKLLSKLSREFSIWVHLKSRLCTQNCAQSGNKTIYTSPSRFAFAKESIFFVLTLSIATASIYWALDNFFITWLSIPSRLATAIKIVFNIDTRPVIITWIKGTVNNR